MFKFNIQFIALVQILNLQKFVLSILVLIINIFVFSLKLTNGALTKLNELMSYNFISTFK